MKDKPYHIPYGLKGISIEGFRGIGKASLENIPQATPWIFLTGNNGYGKSCLLQAIFLGFWGQNQDGSTILEQEPFELQLSGYKEGGPFTQLVDQETRSRPSSETFPIVAYGPSRLELLGGLSADEEQKKSTTSYSLFNPDGLLLNIESQLKDWFIISSSKELEDKEAISMRNKYNGVVAALVELMPNIAHVQVDIRESKILYTEKDAFGADLPEKRTLSQIASGSKSILAMVGDLIIRLFRMQPNVRSPKELEGIVIIDELDLHLHPKWQKALPQLLSKVFPKVQFIASTHSAIPFLGAPAESVFLKVERTVEDGITVEQLDIDIKNLTPNLILSSPIFGFSEIFPATHTPQDRIQTEDTYVEKELNDLVEQRLQQYKDSPKEQELLNIFESRKGK